MKAGRRVQKAGSLGPGSEGWEQETESREQGIRNGKPSAGGRESKTGIREKRVRS